MAFRSGNPHFKFQSDSINTSRGNQADMQTITLNSNLILLIPFGIFLQLCNQFIFKFQSDSINTVWEAKEVRL